MPSIMVYTEETFYYTDGIRVVAREEYMRPDVTELSSTRKKVSGLDLKLRILFIPCRESGH